MLPIDQEIRSKNVIANPAPLGLSAFAMSTFVFSMFSVVDIKIPQVGLGLALFYGGFIQLLAGMWEMKNGNTFCATLLSSYGGFWISFGFIFLPSSGITDAYKDNMEMLDNAIGIYLIGWTICN
nr:1034_t:CDS:2 [Entrophospora candida]